VKNYVIGLLLVVILVLGTLLFKAKAIDQKLHFPLVKEAKQRVEVPLYLYLFFNRNNCVDCLKIIDVLNGLPAQFEVIGVVPKRDLDDEIHLREITGVKFKLIDNSIFKGLKPFYTPTIVGISKAGKMYFMMPSVPGGTEYFEKFVDKVDPCLGLAVMPALVLLDVELKEIDQFCQPYQVTCTYFNVTMLSWRVPSIIKNPPHLSSAGMHFATVSNFSS
jgi:thioredoxin-related protein